MRVLILGAAGMLGRKLVERIARDGGIGGRSVAGLDLVDVVPPAAPAGFDGAVTTQAADLSEPAVAARLVKSRPDLIYQLAAIVSGEAEADLEKGYRVNLDGCRNLFDAIRLEGGGAWAPKLVFTSSIAVFGGGFPAVIPDDYILTPQTSYGAQKAIGELILADYTRRGILHGIGLRLPTICVRPGKPNRAASSFFSGIIREPLAGQEAILPVPETVRHWLASPRAAVEFLLHAAGLETARLDGRPNLTMPGLSATVGEQLAALRAVAGERVAGLVRREPDPVIERIVHGWAQAFDARRAASLGFVAETRFEQIIEAHIEDELGGKLPALPGCRAARHESGAKAIDFVA